MTKLRVLIVDDEPLARERLRTLLCQEPSVEIAGECGDGLEAVATIRRGHLDIIFLDVQMPGCDGLQVVAEISADQRPAIVFVTAHEHFAVEAFGVQAIDFLLKPFDRARLQQALHRARGHIYTRRADDLGTRMENLLAATPGRKPARLAVKADGRVIFLRPDEIVWVEAANNYSTLHLVDGKRLMLRETLSAVERRLGTVKFVRVNRSAVVQIDQVQELQQAKYGDYLVVLRTGQRLPLSRNLQGRLEKFTPGGL
jgi:two-component system LytT family response regulator